MSLPFLFTSIVYSQIFSIILNLAAFYSHPQAHITPRLFFCSLCLRVCSLFGLHNQLRLTVPTKCIVVV
jgi:hypothetical protein